MSIGSRPLRSWDLGVGVAIPSVCGLATSGAVPTWRASYCVVIVTARYRTGLPCARCGIQRGELRILSHPSLLNFTIDSREEVE